MDIVEIASGRLRGRLLGRDVYSFKGIPYAASTAADGRFMPPAKPVSWAGVRSADDLPPQCPQLPPIYGDADTENYFDGALEPLHNTSEDCLALNVWTPAQRDNQKYPVMVWCHGGGFEQGSGGAPWDDGANLARCGKVVVVTINHRLNVLGYLYLGELGDERYRDSGNAGMLDIVQALHWVQDNISAFGGDPGNVTLFGQSGGGFKISVLLAMPAAAGLFHKAIIQSGSALRMATRADATRASELLLAELNLKISQLNKLKYIPTHRLHAAMIEVQKIMGGVLGLRVFCPVVDGVTLPMHPVEAAMQATGNIPLLVGVTLDETRSLLGGSAFLIEQAALPEALQQFTQLDEIATHNLINAYKVELSGATPSDIFFAITTDYMFRANAIQQAEQWCRYGKSPVYMYLFSWAVPTFNGKFKAAHAADEPFVFGNLDKAAGLGGVSPEKIHLSDRMMQSWISFAYTGNPNHSALPCWRKYTLDTRTTMVLNNVCQIIADPNRSTRVAMQSVIGE